MPHAIIERSDNLVHDFIEHDIDLVAIIHEVMIDSGLFDASAVKTREVTADNWMVGEKGEDGSFVHLTVSILAGRTAEQRGTLSDSLLDALTEALVDLPVDQITVEIREMAKESYRKYIRAV